MTTRKSYGYSERKFIESLLDGPLTFGMAVEALRARDEISQTVLAPEESRRRSGF